MPLAESRSANGDFLLPQDVYSFGVLLWEMCCGTRAWAGLSTAQVTHSGIVGGGPVRLRLTVLQQNPGAQSSTKCCQQCLRAPDAWRCIAAAQGARTAPAAL
jgi:hypothetical protein